MVKTYALLSVTFLLFANIALAEDDAFKNFSTESLKSDRSTTESAVANPNSDTLHNDLGVAVQHLFLNSALKARSGRIFISPMISYSLDPEDTSKVDTVWVGPAINYDF